MPLNVVVIYGSVRTDRARIGAARYGASIPADAEPADLERYLYQFRIGPMGSSIVSMMSARPEERKPFWAGKSGEC